MKPICFKLKHLWIVICRGETPLSKPIYLSILSHRESARVQQLHFAVMREALASQHSSHVSIRIAVVDSYLYIVLVGVIIRL